MRTVLVIGIGPQHMNKVIEATKQALGLKSPRANFLT